MSRRQRQAVNAVLRVPRADHELSIAEVRAGFAQMMAAAHVPDGVTLTDTTLAGLPAVHVGPEQPGGERPTVADALLLYFHGGAYVFGSPADSMSMTANLVVRSGIPALSLDYRLAPEHPFPAGIEDCVAAYAALLDDGHKPARIAFVGDSAGGGLAVTACLAARARGLALPAAIVAFSAGLDATRSGATMESKADVDPVFDRDRLTRFSSLYLNGSDPHQELLSPAIYGDLTGMPPMLLQSGGNELLLDDSVRIAERAREAGVDVILDVTADAPHVFQMFAGRLDEADEALDRAALFLRQRVGGT